MNLVVSVVSNFETNTVAMNTAIWKFPVQAYEPRLQWPIIGAIYFHQYLRYYTSTVFLCTVNIYCRGTSYNNLNISPRKSMVEIEN